MLAKLLLLALLIGSTTSACIEAEYSDLDSANGGLLGTLLAIVAGSNNTTTTYYAFDDTLTFFSSSGSGDWTATTASGATGGLKKVRHGGGQILWALDNKANNNLVRSDDLGTTWNAVTTFAVTFETLEVCGDTIFMTANSGANWDAVYSNNGGASWATVIIASPGAFAIRDAACADANRLVVINNQNPTAYFSTNGGASWSAGAGLAGSPAMGLAILPDSNEVMIVSEVPPATIERSSDLTVNYAIPDSATLTGANFSGAAFADSSGFYTAARNGTFCNAHDSATGNSGTFGTLVISCANTVTLTHIIRTDTRIFYGGSEGATEPRLFRINLDDGLTTAQETLPGASGTALSGLLSVTN